MGWWYVDEWPLNDITMAILLHDVHLFPWAIDISARHRRDPTGMISHPDAWPKVESQRIPCKNPSHMLHGAAIFTVADWHWCFMLVSGLMIWIVQALFTILAYFRMDVYTVQDFAISSSNIAWIVGYQRWAASLLPNTRNMMMIHTFRGSWMPLE